MYILTNLSPQKDNEHTHHTQGFLVALYSPCICPHCHTPLQAVDGLLSVTIDQFAFSRYFYKWNHTSMYLLLSGFFYSAWLL